jgi:membrane-associated phospholipid phosphatase
MGGAEGRLSALCHFLLALAVAYHVVASPFGTGTRSILCFFFSQVCVKGIKLLSKRGAVALGNDGPGAFWRRPPNSPRREGSAGFPSSHTSNTASISLFIALDAGWSPLWAAALTFAMAAGRMSDNSHRPLQTVAGLVIGPALGLAARLAMSPSWLDVEALEDTFRWRLGCVLVLVAGALFLLLHTVPIWLAAFRSGSKAESTAEGTVGDDEWDSVQRQTPALPSPKGSQWRMKYMLNHR